MASYDKQDYKKAYRYFKEIGMSTKEANKYARRKDAIFEVVKAKDYMHEYKNKEVVRDLMNGKVEVKSWSKKAKRDYAKGVERKVKDRLGNFAGNLLPSEREKLIKQISDNDGHRKLEAAMKKGDFKFIDHKERAEVYNRFYKKGSGKKLPPGFKGQMKRFHKVMGTSKPEVEVNWLATQKMYQEGWTFDEAVAWAKKYQKGTNPDELNTSP